MALRGRGSGLSVVARVLAVALAAAAALVVLPGAAGADVYGCRMEGGEYRSQCADVTDVSGSLPLRLGAGYGDTVPGTAYHNGDSLALACWTTGPADASGAGDRYWLKVFDPVTTSVEGFVSDVNLTTGTTTDWQQHVSRCDDPAPRTGTPYQCRMQGGEYRSWCANVTGVPNDLWLPLDREPGYGTGEVAGTKYHNDDPLALGCWTTGPQDYGQHGDTYWFSVFDPNDPSIEGYVNDYGLTTGAPADWKKVVSACDDTPPAQRCDNSTFHEPAHAGVPEALTKEDLRCTTPFTRGDTASDAAALTKRLGGRVGLAQALTGSPPFTLPAGTCGSTLPRYPNQHFCWPLNDQFTNRLPQGISSSDDASGPGAGYGGHRYLAASWHVDDQGTNHRSRVTFVNMDGWAGWPHRFRHVLLVAPKADGTGCEPVGLHAGGLVWYGTKLYVADDSARGISVFDLRDLARPSAGSGCDGEGYAYVLPRVATYDKKLPGGAKEHMRVNYLSLDRSAGTPALVAGEYQHTAAEGHSQVVRYPLNTTTGLLTETAGVATATTGYRTGVINAQGALFHNGRLYLSASNDDTYGYLYTWDETPGHTLTRHSWAKDAENLTSFDNRLWSLTELKYHRAVFSVPESTFD